MTTTERLNGRHALVCGASGGIGEAIAIALSNAGASVTLLARRRDKLADVAARLDKQGTAGSKTHILQADLDDRAALATTISAHLEQAGPMHILINNTGGPAGGPILEAEPEAFIEAFGRHVVAAQTLLRLLLPGMREAGFGRIVNIVSTSVREPIPNLGVSNTIRGAMASWAKSVSKELPPGLTINNVLPGFTQTERLDELKAGAAKRTGRTNDDVHAAWLAMIPEGRLAEPAEMAAAVAFLASPAAAYIRGVSLPVDGGRLASI